MLSDIASISFTVSSNIISPSLLELLVTLEGDSPLSDSPLSYSISSGITSVSDVLSVLNISASLFS